MARTQQTAELTLLLTTTMPKPSTKPLVSLSRWHELPEEIKFKIWKHVFTMNSVVFTSTDGTKRRPSDAALAVLALLRVSKIIYNQYAHTFWTENVFNLLVIAHSAPSRLCYIRTLWLDINPFMRVLHLLSRFSGLEHVYLQNWVGRVQALHLVLPANMLVST